MSKVVASAVNVVGVIFLSRIYRALASEDNSFADVYHSARGNGRYGSIYSVGSGIDISKGIHRGEASRIYNPERDDRPAQAESMKDDSGIGETIEASYNSPEHLNQPSGTAQSPGDNGEDLNFDHMDVSENLSCEENTENLLDTNADIRFELSAIDIQYLENGSIENACDRDGNFFNCKFDFLSYPNNLQAVCNNHMGRFYGTEHSIQCHNPNTMESLYYQFDHYPSCFSAACEQNDVTRLVLERIDTIAEAISNYLDMSCLVDDDILRNANIASLIDSSGCKILSYWAWVFPVLLFLLNHWI